MSNEMFLKIFLLTIICHVVLSYSKIPEDVIQSFKLASLSDNHYFQATQQIFLLCKNNDTQQNKANITVPVDYTITPGIGAHKFHQETLNWNSARNVCIKEGAHLAIIDSQAEENLINKWVIERKVDETWLGYHEQFQTGDWVTALDQRMDSGYVHWKIGEPNHLGGVEHCVTYMKNGAGMNDKDCNVKISFICKIYLN